MKIAVILFPGSNCDQDVHHVINRVAGIPGDLVWHEETSLKGYDAVILPGGFAHGDYLRAGAIARFSPVMDEVRRFAREGRPVLGICNGFQVLLEAGLLPGAMLRNRHLKFLCRDVHLKVERVDTPFTGRYENGRVVKIPIAHMEGNYFAPPDLLEKVEANNQVVVRYVRPDGIRNDASERDNPNGSLHAIAGVSNEAGNVVGMMPHPERCSEMILGNTDGLPLFESLRDYPGGSA